MKYKKLFLFFLFFLIVIILGLMTNYIIDKKQTIPYTIEESYSKEIKDVFGDIKKSLDKMEEEVQVEHDETKTYIYINTGVKQIPADSKIDFKITKISEKDGKIEVYARETGHCTFKYFLKNNVFGFLFKGTDISYTINKYTFQIISINKTDKPIEVLWQKHLSC